MQNQDLHAAVAKILNLDRIPPKSNKCLQQSGDRGKKVLITIFVGFHNEMK